MLIDYFYFDILRMDNIYFDLMEYCKNPIFYVNLKNPTTVCSVVMFIQEHGGIIQNEEQFVKIVDEYLCYHGYLAGTYMMPLLHDLYPDIFNSEENEAAFRRTIENWY